MTKVQMHGMTSLGFISAAFMFALVAMFLTSWVLGMLYLLILATASGAILYAYCAKCPCKEAHCGHVFPGKLATRIYREPGPYTIGELAVLGVSLLLLIGLPQLWLWRYPILLVAFWGLQVIGLTQILIVVCRACDNVYCPVNPKRSNT